jgi:hypothetical protein
MAKAKKTDAEKVADYMQDLKHPKLDVIEALRQLIASTDSEIGEEIKWNAPAFFYTGEMQPFDPKEYKRHIVVFNFSKKDAIRLVFPSGAKVDDTSGLLEGDYTDGRRLATFTDVDDVKNRGEALQKVIRDWLVLVEK